MNRQGTVFRDGLKGALRKSSRGFRYRTTHLQTGFRALWGMRGLREHSLGRKAQFQHVCGLCVETKLNPLFSPLPVRTDQFLIFKKRREIGVGVILPGRDFLRTKGWSLSRCWHGDCGLTYTQPLTDLRSADCPQGNLDCALCHHELGVSSWRSGPKRTLRSPLGSLVPLPSRCDRNSSTTIGPRGSHFIKDSSRSGL